MRDARCEMRDVRCEVRGARCETWDESDARWEMRYARWEIRDEGFEMQDGVCGGGGDGAVRRDATRDARRATRDALPHCSRRKISHFREQGAMKLPAWKRLRPRWPYSNIAMGRSQQQIFVLLAPHKLKFRIPEGGPRPQLDLRSAAFTP